MSDGITGTATYKCEKCGAKHYLHDSDFFFESESGSERGMGEEVQHCYELDEECHNCNNGIHLRFEVWEYPVGIINMTNEDASGAEIIECDFGIDHAPPQEKIEETANLIKSLVFFKFDDFAETFVNYWLKSYRKAPHPTTIISSIGLLAAITGGAISIYELDKGRSLSLEKSQSYSEQFELLKNTEENLNDLSLFISKKNNEIEITKELIENLESKKSELEPIVTANQEVVDAIFLQQRKEIEKTIWTERGISFLLGIIASLIATIVWHFVGRFKKEKSNKQNQSNA